MPVTSVTRSTEDLTLTVVAEFAAPVERLWDAYVDPRQLERFWGPPTYPAAFTLDDAAVGGRSAYTMTGPEGDSHGGYGEWLALDPHKSFEVRDGFARPDGGELLECAPPYRAVTTERMIGMPGPARSTN